MNCAVKKSYLDALDYYGVALKEAAQQFFPCYNKIGITQLQLHASTRRAKSFQRALKKRS